MPSTEKYHGIFLWEIKFSEEKIPYYMLFMFYNSRVIKAIVRKFRGLIILFMINEFGFAILRKYLFYGSIINIKYVKFEFSTKKIHQGAVVQRGRPLRNTMT